MRFDVRYFHPRFHRRGSEHATELPVLGTPITPDDTDLPIATVPQCIGEPLDSLCVPADAFTSLLCTPQMPAENIALRMKQLFSTYMAIFHESSPEKQRHMFDDMVEFVERASPQKPDDFALYNPTGNYGTSVTHYGHH